MSYKLEDVIGMETWKRGMWIGFAVIGLFVVGAGLLFLLSLLIDWETETRLLVALLGGPLIGTVLGIVYYLVRRPKISTLTPKEKPADDV